MRIDFKKAQDTFQKAENVFRFEVVLVSGPISERFIAENPNPPMRIIEILGSQNLDDLHQCIFKAFDRDDPHLYEFQVGGDGPYDRDALRFGITNGECGEEDSRKMRIDGAPITIGTPLLYLFDFGDDWLHDVTLTDVTPLKNFTQKKLTKKSFPRIVERYGDSPPQYLDWDEEESHDDDSWDDEILKQLEPNAPNSLIKTRYHAILGIIENFCMKHLNEECTELSKEMLQDSFRKHLPLDRSLDKSWAAGILHALGYLNDFDNPQAPSPDLPLNAIAKHLKVGVSTMEAKSRILRDELDFSPFSSNYILMDMQEDDLTVIDAKAFFEIIGKHCDNDITPEAAIEIARDKLFRLMGISQEDQEMLVSSAREISAQRKTKTTNKSSKSHSKKEE